MDRTDRGAGKAMRGAAVSGRAVAPRRGAAARLGLAWFRRLIRLFFRLRRRLRMIGYRLGDTWRRSLQLRVITATFLVSCLVVTALGFVLMQQIEQNIVASKERSTAGVAALGLAVAQGTPGVKSNPSPSSGQAMYNIVHRLQASTSNSDTDYAVFVTLPARLQGYPVFSGGAQVGFSGGTPTPPADLVAEVRGEDRSQVHPLVEPQTMNVFGHSRTPGLLYGAPFGSVYQLYYFFPLTSEQASLAQAQRTLLLVGVAVVFLLAAIAWLVTRWVVAPVRLAARGALLLSTGNLDERMQVRGTDDLAALATSFNLMAASLQDKLRELETRSEE